ncbi:MAG: acyl-CoA dehydrogenase family protein, partial [Cyanobacteria bacterium J06642_11]
IIQLLFTSILVKHGTSQTKDEIMPKLMAGDIGGIAITEPSHGSDALNMQTCYTNNSQAYSISGTKHWQGLSGETEWFLIAAREKTANQKLAGNVDFFLHEMNRGGMEIIERYHTPGLLMMQYAKNSIQVDVPKYRKMMFPMGTRNPLIMDVFNTARLAFPAMGLGFLKRIYDEAKSYTSQRQINGRPLDSYDLAQFRLEHLRAWKDLCLVLFEYSIQHVNVYQSVADKTLLADFYKVLISEIMLKASHSLQQLHGGMGYRRLGFPERAFADSRPFQILDGSNDILLVQIAWLILKALKTSNADDFPRFLSGFELTKLADKDALNKLVTIQPDYTMPQRKLLQLGQLLTRLIALHCVRDIQEKNILPEESIDNAAQLLNDELGQLLYIFEMP